MKLFFFCPAGWLAIVLCILLPLSFSHPIKSTDIVGQWTVVPCSIILYGQKPRESRDIDLSTVILDISPPSENENDVTLKVFNTFSFPIQVTKGGSWNMVVDDDDDEETQEDTPVPEAYQDLEDGLKYLVQNPNSVTINRGRMTVSSGNSQATFQKMNNNIVKEDQ